MSNVRAHRARIQPIPVAPACSCKLPCREHIDRGSSNLLSLGRAWPGVRMKPQGLAALVEPWASGMLSSRQRDYTRDSFKFPSILNKAILMIP